MDEAPNQSLKNRNIKFMFENTRVQQQISNTVSKKRRKEEGILQAHENSTNQTISRRNWLTK